MSVVFIFTIKYTRNYKVLNKNTLKTRVTKLLECLLVSSCPNEAR